MIILDPIYNHGMIMFKQTSEQRKNNMNGKNLAYIRVSTIGQNTERQLDGMIFDRTFTDKASAKDTNRPALIEMLEYARDHDVIYVHSIDRLARNLQDLLKIVETIIKKNARIEFKKEGLIFSGESTSAALLMLSIMGSFAAFERSLLRERQQEGILLAKAKGVYKGRLPTLTDEQVKDIHDKLDLGISTARIARDFNISRATVYNYIKKTPAKNAL